MAVTKTPFKAKHGLEVAEAANFAKTVNITQALTVASTVSCTTLTQSGTSAMKIPVGSTAQRSASPSDGLFRANSETKNFEGYIDGSWVILGGTTSLKTGAYQNIELISADAGLGHEVISGAGGIRVYRDVVAYNGAASATGSVVFKLPAGAETGNTMYRFKITGFGYNGSHAAWDMEIGAYFTITGPSWNNPRAVIKGTCPFTSVKVAVDSADGRLVLILGGVTTVQNYPKIVIDTFIPMYQSVIRDWHLGWSASLVTSEAGYTGIANAVLEVVYTTSNFDPGTKANLSGAAFTGVITLPSGSVGVPVLTFTGDTNTGIFRPAADTFAIATGGTLALDIDASGNTNVYGRLRTVGNLSLASWTTTGCAFDAAAATFSDTSSGTDATIAIRAACTFGASAFSSTNAITVTNAATLYVGGRPLAGANTTIVGGWAIWVNSGNSRFGGDVTATGNVTAYSDERLKTDLVVIESALDKIDVLRGVCYTRKVDGSRQTGLVAQDVQKVLPEAVVEVDGFLTVAYGNLAGLFVEAIKELRAEIKELREQVGRLEKL